MSWSLNIGRVAGTVVRVHLTFLLFLGWIFAASYAAHGAAAAWGAVVFMVLLFLCVLLHEFGHIFTARAFGVTTPSLTLLPIGGVLRAALASRFGYVRATEISASIGQVVAFALGFFGLMYNPILIFIAIFVYLAASSEAHMVALRAASRGVPVSHAMMTHFETL